MNRGRLILVLSLLVNFLPNSKAIVGGVTSKVPEPDEPVVFSPNARVEGLRKSSNGLYTFLGIQYANVVKRFTRPVYRKLVGDVDAIMHGPPCAQPDPRNNSIVVGTEDCLVLNIFTPKMPDEDTLLPVIMWIHGGGYRFGSAAQYGPDPITDNQVIFVAIQYRLGTLGVLGSGRREFPGNLAISDCAMALHWITEHIEFFGGDPNKLKVMGQGSGAAMAMHLSASDYSKNLITGVIAMSGTFLTKHSIEEFPDQSATEVAELNDCTGKSDDPKIIVQCLRERKLQDLIRVDNRIADERMKRKGMESGLTGFLNFLPHIEAKDDDRGLPGFLTESPSEILKMKHLPLIPLLIGVNSEETANGMNLQSIQKRFGSAEKFLTNITSKLGDVKKILSQMPVVNALNLQLPDVAKYLSIPRDLPPIQILSKLVEVTTDVLFNLPATVVADAWSRTGAPAYFYQFAYSATNSRKGSDFLEGLPLVEEADGQRLKKGDGNKSPVAHGDELGILFDGFDIFGKPLERKAEMSSIDLKVRKQFAKIITDFVVQRKNETTKESKIFSSKGLSFMKITDSIEMKTDFRFCELSLWGANLQSSSGNKNCKNILPAVIPLTGSITGQILPGTKPKPTNTGLLGFL